MPVTIFFFFFFYIVNLVIFYPQYIYSVGEQACAMDVLRVRIMGLPLWVLNDQLVGETCVSCFVLTFKLIVVLISVP